MCGERHTFELNHCRRQHVIRKARREESAKLRPRHHSTQHNVSNELRLGSGFLPGKHYRLADVFVCLKRRLDFAELYAKAAHLHLVVRASDVFEFSSSKPAAQITGAVYLSIA